MGRNIINKPVMAMLISFGLISVLVLSSCKEPEIILDGIFAFDSPPNAPKYKSFIVLSKDGTFEQTVEDERGVITKVSGKWKQTYRAFDVNHLLFLVDLDRPEWSKKPIEVFGATATIEGDYLIFSEETGFAYHRVR